MRNERIGLPITCRPPMSKDKGKTETRGRKREDAEDEETDEEGGERRRGRGGGETMQSQLEP